MQIRRGVFTTALVTTVLALILAGAPGVAFGLQILVGTVGTLPTTEPLSLIDIFNATTVLVSQGQLTGDDCSILSPATTCVVTLPIPASDQGSFKIFSGGTAVATKTAGSINKVTLNNLTIQAGPNPVTVAVFFFHTMTGVNESIARGYGQAASGSLCRPDVLSNCQTAVNDSVRLNSIVIYAKSNGNLGDPTGCLAAGQCALFSLPQSKNNGPYTVLAGGVANNNYFPESTFPTTTQTAQCPFSGTCQNSELLASVLTFKFTLGSDAVIQKATHVNVSGPDLGDVERTLNAEAVMMDIQPLPAASTTPDLSNNDINLGTKGKKQVALFSQVDASTNTIIFDPSTAKNVRFAAGDGGSVSSVGGVSHPDLNLDGVPDNVYSFDISQIAAGGTDGPPGTCETNTETDPTTGQPIPGTGFAVGVGILTGTADFTSVSVTQKPAPTGHKPPPAGCTLDPGGQTMTCTSTVTQTLPFSGQQTFTCAPRAS